MTTFWKMFKGEMRKFKIVKIRVRKKLSKKDKEIERNEYLKYKEQALQIVNEKILKVNSIYNFNFNKISIKNTRTRWGSCSSKKNLSFNYKLVFLDSAAQEYLVAHELCHLKEMNHAKSFWDLVAETIPDYKVQKEKLKNYHFGAHE